MTFRDRLAKLYRDLKQPTPRFVRGSVRAVRSFRREYRTVDKFGRPIRVNRVKKLRLRQFVPLSTYAGLARPEDITFAEAVAIMKELSIDVYNKILNDWAINFFEILGAEGPQDLFHRRLSRELLEYKYDRRLVALFFQMLSDVDDSDISDKRRLIDICVRRIEDLLESDRKLIDATLRLP